MSYQSIFRQGLFAGQIALLAGVGVGVGTGSGMGGSNAAFNGFHLTERPQVLSKGSVITDNRSVRSFVRWMQQKWIKK